MISTLQKSVFLRLIFPFTFGIILAYHFQFTQIYIWVIILLSGCLTFISYFIKRYSLRWIFGMALSCFILGISILLTSQTLSQSSWEIPEEDHTYSLQLLDNPVTKPRTQMCKAKITGSDDRIFSKIAGKQVIVYLPKDDFSGKLVAGDGIIVKTSFKKPESQPNSAFDYASYLRKQGFSAIGYVKKGNWTNLEIKSSFFDMLKFKASGYQRYITIKIKEIVPDPKNAHTSEALFIGYMADLDPELRTSFASTGTSHVLSVSGLHLSILYIILCFFFSLLIPYRNARPMIQVIILLILWLFAFITGLAPSIVRSCIMICFIGMGTVLSRRAFTLNTIAASALFMLLYNPMYLFDVSFQLSYAAVLSIVVINPYFIRFVEFKSKIMNYFGELACVSVSAQIGTAPISVYYFHQFPVFFILSNMFAIPMVGLLLLLLPLCVLLQIIHPFPAYVFSPLNLSLDIFISGIEFFEKIPFAVWNNLNLDI